jgi:Lrp/AsnC family transcriptional regulator
MSTLDDTDLKILEILQRDSTTPSSKLASLVGMSQSPTWRRVVALEQSGAIRKRIAVLDRRALGLGFMVYVLIRLKDQSQKTVDRFRSAVRSIPEILNCHMLMGDIDFLMLIITKDLESYHELLRKKISVIPGVVGIDSRLVIEETKSTTELPLSSLK